MSIQRLAIGQTVFGALTLSLVLCAAGCGSSAADPDGSAGQSGTEGGAATGEGGAEPSSAGNASVGEAGSGGKGGGAAMSECPLDAVARARAESIVMQSINESGWIVNQTHGSGQFASRGFGFAIPLTTVASILSITLMEACTEPNVFEKYCPAPEEGGAESSPCSQLECLGPGELKTTVGFDPVPFTAPLDPPPGEIEVVKAQQAATFAEQDDSSIIIDWTTELEVTTTDEGAISVTHTATGTVDGPVEVPSATGVVAIDGLGVSTLQVDYEASAEDVTGAGVIGDEEILTLTHDGIVWTGSCQ